MFVSKREIQPKRAGVEDEVRGWLWNIGPKYAVKVADCQSCYETRPQLPAARQEADAEREKAKYVNDHGREIELNAGCCKRRFFLGFKDETKIGTILIV